MVLDERTYQQNFLDLILKEDKEDKEELDDSFLPNIIPAGNLKGPQAIAVYQEDYYARLTEAMGETYQAVWSVLGDEIFFEVCREYIKKYSSRSYSLGNYGEFLKDFFKSFSYLEEFPFLPVLAAFEWEFSRLFHSKQHESMDPQELMALDLENVRFVFPEAMRLFQWDYHIYQIWMTKDQGDWDRDRFLVANWDQPQRALFFKQNGKIMVKELEEVPFFLLQGLIEGKALGECLEMVQEKFPTVDEAVISQFFQFFMGSGLVVAATIC